MTCDAAWEYISRLNDGDLSAAESDTLYEHMRLCPACCARLAALGAVSAALREDAAEPPAGFSAGVMRKIKLHNTNKKLFPLPRALRYTVPAAACFIALGLGAVTLLPRLHTRAMLSSASSDSAAAYTLTVETAEEAGTAFAYAETEAAFAKTEAAPAEAEAALIETEAPEAEAAPAEADIEPTSAAGTNAEAENGAAESAPTLPEDYAQEPAPVAAEPAASDTAVGASPIAVYQNASYLGLLDAAALDLDTLLTGTEAELAGEPADGYRLDNAGASYWVYVTEEGLFYRAEGESGLYFSALPAEAFTSALP